MYNSRARLPLWRKNWHAIAQQIALACQIKAWNLDARYPLCKNRVMIGFSTALIWQIDDSFLVGFQNRTYIPCTVYL